MKKTLLRLGSILFLCLLLLNPKLSIEGAKTGLIFWFNTIIPTLLPFMICSNLIIQLDAAKYLTFLFAKPLSNIGRVSENGVYAVIIGFLCGYPMGAKTSGNLVSSKKISKKEGQYLIAFSNHASPMFLLGFVLTAIQSSNQLNFVLAYYLPVIPLMLSAKYYYKIEPCFKGQNQSQILQATEHTSKLDILDSAMTDAFEVIVKIGGHIILFSILESYFAKLPISNLVMKGLLLGSIEITTGIAAIGSLFPGNVIGELLAVSVCAFGGFSGISQTKSVIKESQLSSMDYFMWKALHGLLSAGCFLLLLNLK